MKSALQSLMPAHSSILEIAAEHVALERAAQADPIFAIAQLDRDLALTLKRLLNQLEEGDFSEAAQTSDELSHRIRTHYLSTLSDAEGVAR